MRNLFTALAMTLFGISTVAAQTIKSVDNAEFTKIISDKNIQLVDVRTPEEFSDGHIPGAKNMDIKGAGFEKQIATLDTTKSVAVYCRGGMRSKAAAKKMADRGFTIIDLDNGFSAWNGKVEK